MRAVTKLIWLSVLLTADMAAGRSVKRWSYQELMDEADLVVIADVLAQADVENTDGYLPGHMVQIETTLAVDALLKCQVDDECILKAVSARNRRHEVARRLRRRMAQFEEETRGSYGDPFAAKPEEDVELPEIDESQKARIVASKVEATKHIQAALECIADGELKNEFKKKMAEAHEVLDITSIFGVLVGYLERSGLEIEIKLVHFRYKNGVQGLVNGPRMVRFRTEGPIGASRFLPFSRPVAGLTSKYILFLKRRNDGKYEAVSGQDDSVDSVMHLTACDEQ